MKRKIFSLLIFAFFASFILSACSNNSNIECKFNQNEYVVSIGETINFFDEIDEKLFKHSRKKV